MLRPPQETTQLDSNFNLESNFNEDYIHANSCIHLTENNVPGCSLPSVGGKLALPSSGEASSQHPGWDFSPPDADGSAPVCAAMIQRMSVLNTEVATTLVTSHWQHLFLLTPLFRAPEGKNLRKPVYFSISIASISNSLTSPTVRSLTFN